MQIAVSTKQISMGHARALVAIADAKWQKVVFDRILDQGLSVRKAEALAAAGPGGTTQRPSPRVVMSFDEQNVLAELKDKFGRNAELKSKGNGAGKIELTYRNAGELEEILKSMNL
jgi:ParB family chromosome partitioning protein